MVAFSIILHSCQDGDDLYPQTLLGTVFSGGTGIKNDPYQISNLEELRILSENHFLWDRHFILIDDIDASDTKNWNDGKGFSPIGFSDKRPIYDLPFRGSFNGAGHVIENLYINRNYQQAGFFGLVIHSKVGDPWIENLGLVNCQVQAANQNFSGAGLIVVNKGNVRKCYVTGLIQASNNTGGLVGINKGYIENSYAKCHVYGGVKMGGLVGYNETEIVNCYAVPHQIKQSKYSDDVGGLIGYNNKNSKVIRSFWDWEVSDIHRPCGRNLPNSQIRGAKTEMMKIQSTFNNWDFKTIWKMDKENDGYPSLKFNKIN
jgi:hypothetical protein